VFGLVKNGHYHHCIKCNLFS